VSATALDQREENQRPTIDIVGYGEMLLMISMMMIMMAMMMINDDDTINGEEHTVWLWSC
jgi:hypothetical protein